MEKSASPGKSGLLYGVLLFGVIMVLEFVVMYIIGMRSLGTSAESLLTLPTTSYITPRIHLFRMHQLKSKQRLYLFGESLRSEYLLLL
jgi:hypothetical protein